MTKASTSKTRSATFEDLRAARFRTAEVLGLGAEGEARVVHYKALSGAKVVEYMDREQDKDMPTSEKYRLAVTDLADSLVTETGKALATQKQLMELPADTITVLMKTVAGIKEGDEGNVSGEADGAASPIV